MSKTKGGQMEERLDLRIPAELKATLERLAKEDRRPLSDYVRLLLEDAIEEQKKGGKS